MTRLSYLERRGQIETYFDRTAVEAWARLTSDAPVGRIRATVRAGRDRMRATLLVWLPADLRGAARARCRLRHRRAGGRGGAARRRGRRDRPLADAGRAGARAPAGDRGRAAAIDFRAGDMLDPALGRFDHVVAMDSLIHYRRRRRGARARRRWRSARGASMLFTFAPRTPALAAMHRASAGCSRAATARRRSSRSPSDALRRLIAADAALRRLAPRPHAAHRERLLHLAGAGARARHEAALQRPQLAPRHGRSVGPRFLPFADAATPELPLPRLLRLSLFQVSVGMATVLLIGTLNRVMIVELGVPAWLVALMVALPLVFAPFRALIGFRSDTHRSVLGWRRVPYIWMGTLLQFGGLAIMPFALIVLSGDSARAGLDRRRPARRSPSCWSAPACRRRRPPASRWPPTWRRPRRGRASSR